MLIHFNKLLLTKMIQYSFILCLYQTIAELVKYLYG